MKIKLVLLAIIFFPKTHSWSQTSMEAKNLLEKASKQLEFYDSFKLEFSYNLNNRMEKINQESKGNVVVSYVRNADKPHEVWKVEGDFTPEGKKPPKDRLLETIILRVP